jgi:colanic acid biosynthesis glycosyl transferase WcaI
MRIVIVVAVFPPEFYPSAVMALELARNWSLCGHDVTVISPFPNRPHGKIHKGYIRRLWQRTDIDNVHVLRVWSWFIGPNRHSINRLLENLSFGFFSSIALLFQKKPDLVILESWPIFAKLGVTIVSKIRKLRSINYVKDLYPEAMIAAGMIDESSLTAKLLLWIDNRIYGLANCNIVISENVKEVVTKTRVRSSGKVYVIRDWLDLQYIKPFEGKNTWRGEVGISENEIVFMFAGTMGFASGVDILVRVAEILQSTPGIRIVCVGEGPLKEIILREQQVKKLSNLTVLGFQPRARVNEMQSTADVMLLITSPQMGVSSVPSKLITYLAVGKPVLCSVAETSDIAHLVKTNDIGLVVPPGDVERISEGIIELASMGREQLHHKGLRGRELALQMYSLPRALRDFEDLFGKILRENSNNSSRSKNTDLQK